MDQYNNEHANEIDLVELIGNLWEERKVFLTGFLLSICIGAAYLALTRPVFVVSAQINPPNSSTLKALKPFIRESTSDILLYVPNAPLRQQQELADLIKRSSENQQKAGTYLSERDYTDNTKAFTIFLSELESNAHIYYLLGSHEHLIADALGIKPEKSTSTIPAINKVRLIEYPNTTKKNNELQPDSYLLTLEGYDKEKLELLLREDISKAEQSTTEKIKDYYISELETLIENKNSKQRSDLLSLENRINARKFYLSKSQQTRIAELNERLKIAKIIDDAQNIKTLGAEIQLLSEREKSIFYDEDLLTLEAQKYLVGNDKSSTKMAAELERIKSINEPLRFSDEIIITPTHPIHPKKPLIMALSAILGIIVGLCAAIGRITYRKVNKATL
ncbi:Wzz/FepE/Etk N-terminal domain-containing protein [Eionea flava]